METTGDSLYLEVLPTPLDVLGQPAGTLLAVDCCHFLQLLFFFMLKVGFFLFCFFLYTGPQETAISM